MSGLGANMGVRIKQPLRRGTITSISTAEQWRCKCGTTNRAEETDCRNCEKRRWEQFGWDPDELVKVIEAHAGM